MAIERLRLSNFKRFESLELDVNRELIAILGENSSGKSSVLKAILALKQTASVTNEHEAWAAHGEYVDLGVYQDYIYNKDIRKSFDVSLTLSSSFASGIPILSRFVDGQSSTTITLAYDHDVVTSQSRFISVRVEFNHKGKSLSWQLVRQKTRPNYVLSLSDDLIGAINETFSFESERGLSASSRIVVEHAERFSFDIVPRKRQTFNEYFAYRVVNETLRAFGEYLESELFYLAPLRSSPSRSYIRSSHSLAVGVHGEHTPSVLANLEARARKVTRGSSEHSENLRWLNNAINQVFPGHSVTSATFDELVKLRIASQETQSYASSVKSDTIADVGFGFSQVLPILVQLAIMPRGTTLLVEQPELHLHPLAQTRLARVLAQAAARGRRLVVETHSEHLIRGLQLAVSEARVGSKSKAPELSSREIGFYYFRRGKNPYVHLQVNEYGEFLQDWPPGFFDESYRNLRALIANRSRESLKSDGERKMKGRR